MPSQHLGQLIDKYTDAEIACNRAKAEYDHTYAIFAGLKHQVQRAMHSAPMKAYKWRDKIYILIDGKLETITPLNAEETTFKSQDLDYPI